MRLSVFTAQCRAALPQSALKGVGLVALLFWSGCVHSVTILRPTDKSVLTQPTNFDVDFNARADLATFRFFLDGNDITSSFNNGTTAPPPVFQGGYPGGPVGIHEARATATMSPSQAFDLSDFSIRFTPPAITFDHAGGHRAPVHGAGIAEGIAGTPTHPDTDPHPGGSATMGRPATTSYDDLQIQETQTEVATLLVPSAPPGTLTITLTPSSNLVSINAMPAGAPASVTVPNTDRRVTFSVRGIQSAAGTITASAAGYQVGLLPIVVWH